jgi:hypothetical protein
LQMMDSAPTRSPYRPMFLAKDCARMSSWLRQADKNKKKVGDSTGLCLVCVLCRDGQDHIYTVYIRYSWQGNHQIYGYIRCMYTFLANPSLVCVLCVCVLCVSCVCLVCVVCVSCLCLACVLCVCLVCVVCVSCVCLVCVLCVSCVCLVCVLCVCLVCVLCVCLVCVCVCVFGI